MTAFPFVAAARAAIASPCIRVCVLDGQGQVCRGCGRTTAQIASWQSYSDAERRAVMDQLPGPSLSYV